MFYGNGGIYQEEISDIYFFVGRNYEREIDEFVDCSYNKL